MWGQEWWARPETLWTVGDHVAQDIMGPWGRPFLLHLAHSPAHPEGGRSSRPMPALLTHELDGHLRMGSGQAPGAPADSLTCPPLLWPWVPAGV